MNKFIKHYIERYYKKLYEGINFSDLDDSSDDDVFSNVLKGLSVDYLKKQFTERLNYDIKQNSQLITQILTEIHDTYEKINKPLYITNNKTIKIIILKYIDLYGDDCDLNWIDTSLMTSMTHLFEYLAFNGDISSWDVSNVTDMRFMFYCSVFDGDISNWDVSNVEDMNSMFKFSKFNQDISGWNVSNVTDMNSMFYDSDFEGDISNWEISKVTDMNNMFYYSKFNGDISSWDVSNVTDMSGMFSNSIFNQDISNWDVSNVIDMSEIFEACPIKEEYKPSFN